MDADKKERLQKQLDFILELDKVKSIYRQTYLADGSRKENDSEHSFHLAVMCFLLSDYAAEAVDVAHTMEMLLLHDVVEIDAGDTYAYDVEANRTKAVREEEAAKRIYGLLPGEQGRRYYELWREFEERRTPEAKFANALDRVQPVLLTDRAGGRSWREHGVRRSQIMKRAEYIKDSTPLLYEHVVALIAKNVEKGNLLDA